MCIRMPPGLSPKLVTSTSDAADACAGNRTPATSRVLTSATSAALSLVIVDLRSGIPASTNLCRFTTAVNDLPNMRRWHTPGFGSFAIHVTHIHDERQRSVEDLGKVG